MSLETLLSASDSLKRYVPGVYHIVLGFLKPTIFHVPFGIIDDIQDLFYDACRKESREIVQYLVSKGADPRAKDDTPFILACCYGNHEVVEYLVSLGADVNVSDGEALAEVSFNGDIELVKYLVEKGANVRANDNKAIVYASWQNHTHIIEYLVSKDANISDQALMEASANGSLEAVKLLISLGADVKKDGGEVIQLAFQNGHHDVVEYMWDSIRNESILNDVLATLFKPR